MNKSQAITIQLLRKTLHPDIPINIPKNVNWNGVYNIYEKQGVVAIVWDVVNKLHSEGYFLFQNYEDNMLFMR